MLSGGMLLTQQSGILKPIAVVLGYLMNGIFVMLDKFGVPNIGLAIILFTIVIYALMTPLTVKQQKFSKLSAKMNPEIQAVQKKYKGKKDNESMMAMNQETKAIYAKYGVSPTGSCLQLLIQMPILFALYRVIYSMPAYVGMIKEAFSPLVDHLIKENGSAEFIQAFSNSKMYAKQFTDEAFTSGNVEFIKNTFIDCLNKASSGDWISLSDKFHNLSTEISETVAKLEYYNSFLGINIANSPSFIVKDAFSAGKYLLIVGALMIPLLAAFTQWVNVKLMPQPAQNTNGDSTQNTMAQSMKTMNLMMPIMSAVFCYTLPAGMGIYWIAGAVVRTIQQIFINKHIDKMDIDAELKKNAEKIEKKQEKKNASASQLNNYASMNTKKMNSSVSKYSEEEKEAALKKANEAYAKGVKPGSIAEKANLVRRYNENHE